MEKSISVEERIKRAEERYYNSYFENNYANKFAETKKEEPKFEKKKKKVVRKLLKKIVICIIIYTIFYNITNSNSILSEDIRNKAKEILNIDINFTQLYSNAKNFIVNFLDNIEIKEKNIEENLTNKENKNQGETTQTLTETTDNIQDNNENIGGAIEEDDILQQETNIEDNLQENSNNDEQKENTEDIQLSQMEEDAKFIKENISLIKPIEGTISSKFGLRNPSTITVPKNHTGIDLSASTGTKIISATDGTVVLNSSEGDFGKHIKIQNGDTIFIYAHCSKIYVNEGDEIKQGQEIAEVGTTGNTTGPHLHFEIRYQNRTIDPELILEF